MHVVLFTNITDNCSTFLYIKRNKNPVTSIVYQMEFQVLF